MTNPNEFDDQVRAHARDYNVPGDVPRDRMWARIQESRAAARAPVVSIDSSTRRATRRVWLQRVGAVAAVLVVGFGIGRLYERASSPTVEVAGTTPRSDTNLVPESTPSGSRSTAVQKPDTRVAERPSSVPVSQPPRRGGRVPDNAASERGTERGGTNMAYRLAMLQHLAGTEAMLISFRAAAKSGNVDAQLTSWARDLLTTTRLMQASPVATDPTMKRLLDDLELVLVQIAQYTAKGEHRAEELDLIEHSIERRGVLPKLRTTIPTGNVPAGT